MTATLLGPLPDSVITGVATAASVLTLVCVVPLCVATWQGRAHPSAVTWGIWAPIGLVATVALALGGAPLATWMLKGFLSLGPLLVFIVAAWKGGDWRTDGFDIAAIAIGSVGTGLYAYFYLHEAPWAAYVAIVMAMLVDGVGVWPTWRRGWRDPHNELIKTYALALASVVAVLLVLPWPWTFLSAGLLIFLGLQMMSIIGVLWAGRVREHHAGPAVATA